jgi:hypothetical protein
VLTDGVVYVYETDSSIYEVHRPAGAGVARIERGVDPSPRPAAVARAQKLGWSTSFTGRDPPVATVEKGRGVDN